jgi:hypothetical protein
VLCIVREPMDVLTLMLRQAEAGPHVAKELKSVQASLEAIEKSLSEAWFLAW